MKVAHITVITPKRSGLYETTCELVMGLRDRGIDSRLVDPEPASNKLHPKEREDRGAPIADIAWALTADILVNHSGLGKELDTVDKPVIHVAHGRPRSSFLMESSGGPAVYSYQYMKNKDARFKAVVTFWPEHVPYLQVMFPDKPIHYVQAPVDLAAWTPEGPRGYGFHGKSGAVNVVCADAWRSDVDPFAAINAFTLWARSVPGAKLHLYGVPQERRGWAVLFKRLSDEGSMGEICGWVDGLPHVYRAADLAITANTIATRSVREAMACGCPVVRIQNHLNGFMSDFTTALSTPRYQVRNQAAELFSVHNTAAAFHAVLEA